MRDHPTGRACVLFVALSAASQAACTDTAAVANHSPTIAAVAAQTPEDTQLLLVLAAADPDGDVLSYAFGAPAHGTVAVGPPHIYLPDADFVGDDRFTVTVSDGVLSASASVDVRVTPVDDAPDASDASVTTARGTPVAVTLSANDRDGDALTYMIEDRPEHGDLGGEAPDLVYTPEGGYVGEDAFTFVAIDGALDSAPATVRVIVTPPVPDGACPIAVIESPTGSEAPIDGVVDLDARASYSPSGDILAWHWSLVAAPTGVHPPTLSAVGPIAQLGDFATNADYVVELALEDVRGNLSGSPTCPAGRFTVSVVREAGLRVQLTWTAVDGQPSAADLDLHFAHANAKGPDIDEDGQPDPWFDQHWDTFWFNIDPMWGSLDDGVDDDPRLVLDAESGPGPEVLELRELEVGVTYTIGVHYWDVASAGEAHPTLSIYEHNALIAEKVLPAMKLHDLWCVGRVSGSPITFERCAPEGSPEQVTPDYINVFFQPPL